MKTAEEWTLALWNQAYVGMDKADFRSAMRAIQLDAFRAGIERTAEICDELSEKMSDRKIYKKSNKSLTIAISEAIREASKTAQLP